MPDSEKVFNAFRNCITEPKCKDCPWEQCEQFNQKKFSIPATLALDVLNLLKKQEAVEPKKEWFLNSLNIPEAHWFCGKCDEELVGKGWYCAKCGQAVKWE